MKAHHRVWVAGLQAPQDTVHVPYHITQHLTERERQSDTERERDKDRQRQIGEGMGETKREEREDETDREMNNVQDIKVKANPEYKWLTNLIQVTMEMCNLNTSKNLQI